MACVSVFRQNGRLSKELDLVSHHVRTRLDELKRQEVSRLRMLLKAKLDSTNVQSESFTLKVRQDSDWLEILVIVIIIMHFISKRLSKH